MNSNNLELIKLFFNENLIKKYFIKNNKIYIFFKITKNNNVIKKISTPIKIGQRIYLKNKDLIKKKNSFFFFIFQTPLGLISERDLIYQKIGGFVLCKIYLL